MKKLMLGMLLVLTTAASIAAHAIEYSCEPTRQVGHNFEHSSDQIVTFKISTLIEESSEGSFFSRCSRVSSAADVTCDRYKIDQVVYDKYPKIKKYYHFSSQFDIQLFPDLSFVENNGRGFIYYGKCVLLSP